MFQLLREDPRYTVEAYQFVREALGYAQEVLKLGEPRAGDAPAGQRAGGRRANPPEHHVTGQQLCEAIRLYALDQFGYMAKVVLNSWGIHNTGDFGEIVYNLIRIGWMKTSDRDRREDFDDVYDFDEAFQQHFQITLPDRGD